jgi:terminase large subunit-like protein
MMTEKYSELAKRIRKMVRKDPVGWALTCGIRLRPYQEEIALAIKDSVLHNKGLTFVVILPRQSGKNEVQRHLFAWLLCRAAERGGTIVSVAPTFKPQTINAMERVRLALDSNIVTRGQWKPSAGFIFRFHKARLQFFSGENKAKVVGATADLLLSVDEAQDIAPAKFEKEFDPMTASTNATRVFWGTAWTSQTLLAQQAKKAREEEAKDGIQRVFFHTAEDVAKIVPEYAAHLERVLRERGRQHPLVRTQYFNEDIDAQGGMFNAGRMALMFGDSLNTTDTKEKSKGGIYAFCIDVAGMDEANVQAAQMMQMGNPGRDSTTLSVVEIDLSTLETLQAPTYRVVQREAWQGLNHLTAFGKLKALAETWNPQHIVIDATGVGEGLWAMLEKAFPRRVILVKFSQQEKSEIGWKFLSIIETGRFRAEAGDPMSAIGQQVRMQYANCMLELLPGPGKTLRWGVPDGTRGPDGALVHDDFVLADALVAKLDQLEWSIRFEPYRIQGKDPLEEMSRTRKPSNQDWGW